MPWEGTLAGIPVKAESHADTKCGRCTGYCCTYVTQQIDGPKSFEDFDQLLWQLSHQNVQAYKDTDGWFLIFITTCRHLQPDARCGIYDTRPQLCRDYSNDYCEYDERAEKNFELYFEDDAALLKYLRKRFKNWDRRFSKDA